MEQAKTTTTTEDPAACAGASGHRRRPAPAGRGMLRRPSVAVAGLAQYYGLVACRRLELSAPNAKKAFATLLKHQPTAYKTHDPWVAENKPEEIRLAMIQARRLGQATLEQFAHRLDEAKWNLRSSSEHSAEQS